MQQMLFVALVTIFTHRLALAATTTSSPPTSTGPVSAPPPAPEPILTQEPEKISEHVWVIQDKATTPLIPNVGFIVGTKAILVIETGLGPKNGKFVYQVALKLAPHHEMYLVTTHFHPEHDLGASAFPKSTELIRSQGEVDDISEFNLELAKEFSKRSKAIASLLKGARYRKADLVFDDEKFLDLGDLGVRLEALGPNHTRGDTAIFVEGDRVLFVGDDAMKGQPSFASPYSSLAHWLRTLDFLERLRPKIVVPSHGPIGDRGYITGYRNYLTRIRDRVVALKAAGKSLDAAMSIVVKELSPEYPDQGRLEGAVRNAYREVDSSSPAGASSIDASPTPAP